MLRESPHVDFTHLRKYPPRQMCEIGTFTINGVPVTFTASFIEEADTIKALVSFPPNYPKTILSSRCKDLFMMTVKRGNKSHIPDKVVAEALKYGFDLSKPFIETIEACVFPKIVSCSISNDEKKLTRDIGFLVLQKVSRPVIEPFKPDYIVILADANAFPIISSVRDKYNAIPDVQLRQLLQQEGHTTSMNREMMIEKLTAIECNRKLAKLYEERYGFTPLMESDNGYYMAVETQRYSDMLKVCQNTTQHSA
jgi:hypothetical protein